MISLPRNLVRDLRSVFRRVFGLSPHATGPPVVFEADENGLRVKAAYDGSAVEYFDQGEYEPETFIAPFEVLHDCEGGAKDPVILEKQPGGLIEHWRDRDVPKLTRYDEPTSELPPFPARPKKMAQNEPRLLEAFGEAAKTTDPDSTRFAFCCAQLRGKGGHIIATDGRQLLLQTGFDFPFKEELLVNFGSLFPCRKFPRNQPVQIGASEDHLVVAVGGWTLWLRLWKEARYPKVDDFLQPPSDKPLTLTLSSKDAAHLAKSLDDLPGNDDPNRPVTLDLNGQVIVRAQGEDGKKDLVLADSQVKGAPKQICTNRGYLRRALDAGFHTIDFHAEAGRGFCANDTIRYVWALLSTGEIRTSNNKSSNGEADPKNENARSLPPKSTKKEKSMPKTTTTHQENVAENNGADTTETSLLEQAESLKAALRDAQTKANELVAALRKHKKQTKLMQSTLASLRQLQELDV